MLSIIIPSRNERFLDNTVDDLLKKAEGEIEVIPVLDEGIYFNNDKRVNILKHFSPLGMRRSINDGVKVARGEYIMKLDGHCLLDEGFDKKLIDNCDDDWVVIPRRKRLDAENWCVQEVGKPDIDSMYLSYPDDPNDRGGVGLHGRIWKERILKRLNILIDEDLSAQGSCWFMKKKYFDFLDLMDEKNYGEFGSEMQEIGLKAWLSGGKLMRNKKTWYAHLHKGKKYGRGYRLDKKEFTKANLYTNKWITNSAWKKQTKPFNWLIKRFYPIPGWEENWEDKLLKDFGKPNEK